MATAAAEPGGARAESLREILVRSLKHNSKQYTMFLALIGIWGDIVTGGATVIIAMGAGRKAAAAINDYLQNENNQ